ncbi:g2786 [Coccomyxa elongata]
MLIIRCSDSCLCEDKLSGASGQFGSCTGAFELERGESFLLLYCGEAMAVQIETPQTQTKQMDGEVDDKKARCRQVQTTVALMLSFIVEKADEMILPAAYKFIGQSLNATPAQLGSITLTRALVQALSSPIGGLLGDRLDRTHIIAFGCFLWGVMTMAIGLSTTLTQAMSFSAWNGLGLALVIPCVQSLIADVYSSTTRGRAFGLLFLTSGLGGMAGGFFATSIGSQRPYGVEGWRFAFFVIAGISVMTGFLTLFMAADPRKSELRKCGANRRECFGWLCQRSREMARDIWLVLRVRSFQIIVLQGIVGTMPWVAMGFTTLYLQLLGFSDIKAATLVALFGLGCALGSFGGGYIGDMLTKAFPNSGRIMAAQFSVLMTFPCTMVIYKCLPVTASGGMDTMTLPYAAVFFFTGLLISWSGTNNSAMFAEIVPEQLRSAVYAFDRSFEGAVGATAAPLVGLVAEKVFGFAGSLKADAVPDPALQLANAHALGNAMLVLLLAPWGFDFIFYCGLYYTLPKDRERSRNLGRLLTYTVSDANLCELGKVPAADSDSDVDSNLGKLSMPMKRSSNPTEFFS